MLIPEQFSSEFENELDGEKYRCACFIIFQRINFFFISGLWTVTDARTNKF